MDKYNAGSGSRKCAAVPPILIHGGTPCPPPPMSHGGACILPPISPQVGSLLSGGHHSPFKRPLVSDGDRVKQESFVQTSSCMFNQPQGNYIAAAKRSPPNNIHLLPPNQRPPNRISPLASSGAGIQHVHNGYAAAAAQSGQSSMLFDLSPSHHMAKPRIYSYFDPKLTEKRGKVKVEVQAGMHKLPPLSGYTSGSNLDIDDTLSPLVPPINSLSPYIGSGISDNIPSILASPINSAQLSRKRTLSTSPLSDMFDVYAFRSSPNSLMATLYNNTSNTFSPNGSSLPMGSNGAVGHLIGQSNTPLQAMQYTVQQRKTSIERNQNDDGTTNTTITNQVIFSEQPHSKNMSAEQNLSTEPMEMDMDTFDGHSNNSRFARDEEPVDPHVCLWEGCGETFNDLNDLVQHLENAHIEKGKAEEYICLWRSCIRGRKPFNARYKLLIHMRIHSGEKPNKCTVS